MTCSNCNNDIHELAAFCSKCGKKVKKDVHLDYNDHVKNISIFFFILLGYIACIQLISFEKNYKFTLLIDSLFACIVLVFLFIDYKNLKPLFKINKINTGLCIKILVFAPCVALCVTYLAGYLSQGILDGKEISYFKQFKDSPAPITLSIVSIGLFPAIFEEIAFRGIVFHKLIQITSIKPTIIISSLLFTILHLSLISFIWIFPGALLFGYLRAKKRTLWYGVLAHFVYNSSIVIIEIVNFN